MTETSEQQVSWETIPLIEPISLSLGYKLVALVDKAQGNPLTQRIRGVRQVISDGNGVLLPEIRIRENFRLKPSQYAIFINGIKADEADIPADKLMALPSERNLRRDRRRAGERSGVRDAGHLDSARAESEGAEYGVSGDRQRQRNCHPCE